MGFAKYTYNRSTSGGEIITHLINSTDGTGLHFDGAAGYVDISGSGAPVVGLGTKFSMEFIVQADSASDQAYLVDFYKSSPAARFGIFYDGSGSDFYVYDTGNRSFGAGNVLGDTKVHHLVITVDDTAAILYDNGNQIGIATLGASPTIDTADTAKIGSRHNGTGYFLNGTIYRCRFWNKTLSQPEVTASYENATVPFSDQYGNATVLNSGSVPAGIRWRIIEQNTVDFTSYGAADNDIGTEFVTTASIPALNANDRLQQIGCVADYDLAFSNPARSFMVPDRAGAADGTASNDGTLPTGIVQVTPIEQLNAKAARIGTTAATPADGDLLVSGSVTAAGATFSGDTANGQFLSTIDNTGSQSEDNGLKIQVASSGESSLALSVQTGGASNAFMVTGSGEVGIGLSASAITSKFHVNGASLFASLTTFSAGIAFQTTGTGTGTSSEAFTLDKYETGLWTPTIAFNAGTTGITYNTTDTDGIYTRIGNYVFLDFLIILTSKGSDTGVLQIRGYPFTVNNFASGTSVDFVGGNLYFGGTDINPDNGAFCTAHGGQTYGNCLESSNGQDITNANCGAGTVIRGNLKYRI
jgi:hypothetical protein